MTFMWTCCKCFTLSLFPFSLASPYQKTLRSLWRWCRCRRPGSDWCFGPWTATVQVQMVAPKPGSACPTAWESSTHMPTVAGQPLVGYWAALLQQLGYKGIDRDYDKRRQNYSTARLSRSVSRFNPSHGLCWVPKLASKIDKCSCCKMIFFLNRSDCVLNPGRWKMTYVFALIAIHMQNIKSILYQDLQYWKVTSTYNAI